MVFRTAVAAQAATITTVKVLHALVEQEQMVWSLLSRTFRRQAVMPMPDPGNSSPDEWTRDLTEKELAEVQRRLSEGGAYGNGSTSDPSRDEPLDVTRR